LAHLLATIALDTQHRHPIKMIQPELADQPSDTDRIRQDHCLDHRLFDDAHLNAVVIFQHGCQLCARLFEESGDAGRRACHHQHVIHGQQKCSGFICAVDAPSTDHLQKFHRLILAINRADQAARVAQAAMARCWCCGLLAIHMGDAAEHLAGWPAQDIALGSHDDFGDIGYAFALACQAGERRPVGQHAQTKDGDVSDAHRGIDQAKRCEFKQVESGATRCAIDAIHQDVGACAEQSDGAAQCCHVGHRHQQLGWAQIELAPQRDHHWHHHHHDGCVVHKCAGQRHHDRHEQQHAPGMAARHAHNQRCHCLQCSGAHQTGADYKHRCHRNRRTACEANQSIDRRKDVADHQQHDGQHRSHLDRNPLCCEKQRACGSISKSG
jgi:hypothetical protein